MTLGDIIKSYRSKYGLSMDSFSDKSGISKAYISLLEKINILKPEKKLHLQFNALNKPHREWE